MKNINLSYIIATRNRLPFLKIILERLMNELQQNEEIIVVDGDSTDGAREYLQQLFEEGKIQQFISEPDRNQAHGWNKALLMAKGAIIKKLTDDDVHDFAAIRKCSDFLVANPDVDVCISNHLESDLANPAKVGISGRLPQFTRWNDGLEKTFTFSDVSMLLRRSALSFLGLYDTQFKMMDWEYALRITYLEATIAYYTGCNSLAVGTPGNVTSTGTKDLFMFEEGIGKVKYGYEGDSSDISLYSKIKIRLGKIRYRLLNQETASTDLNDLPSEAELKQIYSFYYDKLDEYNREGEFHFKY
jgi:glycosyltransferase involved in cell wall biosynthesis